MKHTYFIDAMATSHCDNNTEVQAMYSALETALSQYQWYYQQASETKFVTVDVQTTKAIQTTLNFLYAQGQDSVADRLEEVVYDLDKSTLTKSKVLTKAKVLIRKEMTKVFKVKRYEDKFAKLMGEAFIEHCEEFQLDKAPEDLDNQYKFDMKYNYEPDWDYNSGR